MATKGVFGLAYSGPYEEFMCYVDRNPACLDTVDEVGVL